MNLIPFAAGLIRAHWKPLAILAALMALALLWWRADSLRAGYKADLANVRQEYALFRKEVTLKAGEALAAQKAVNIAQEQEWKDKADAADGSIDDLRARLRTALLRPQGSGGSASSPAGSAAQGDDPGLPQEVPAAAPVDRRSVQVDADVLAGLAAYAIAAHDWALSLGE